MTEILPNPAFWAGRRVLVTGHTGFKGGWLCHWLAHMGAQVHGLALAPDTAPSLFERTQLKTRLASHEICDIRDRSAVQAAIAQIDPQVTFHMAAQALVRRAYADPVDSIATNVLGTAHVLDVLRTLPDPQGQQDPRVIINVTSDKCYENSGEGRPFTENDPMGGSDPYSASKGCAELVASAFARSYFTGGATRLASVRAGNVIGGGDWAEDRLVPDIIRALNEGALVEIRNPEATRPWQHVLEPLSGYLAVAEQLMGAPGDAEDSPENGAGGWNFGPRPENAVPVKALLGEIGAITGQTGWVMQPGTHPKEAARLHLDITKAAQKLGWRPVLSLEETAQMTLDWYMAAAAPDADMATFTNSQIAQYCARREQGA